MINLLPEPKKIRDDNVITNPFDKINLKALNSEINTDDLLDLAKLRFWNYKDIPIITENKTNGAGITLIVQDSLDGVETENERIFKSQGYYLIIKNNEIMLKFEHKAGFINGLTSIKQLLKEDETGDGYFLPCCEIVDWPSIPVRAIAPTFSWYAGYGRIGFDSQLWGYDEWVEFLNIALDNKINQFNMLMYGYWPIELEEYPETVFRNVPVEIWNAENRRWLTIRYTHPNLEKLFLFWIH